jgi:hypothetical protein
MILILVALLIGFACGYGVRELIARRRRAARLTKYYQKYPEERPQHSEERTGLLRRFLENPRWPFFL